MIYPSEFVYYSKKFQYPSGNRGITFYGKNQVDFGQSNNLRLSSLWKRFCDCSSIHGMAYLSNNKHNVVER